MSGLSSGLRFHPLLLALVLPGLSWGATFGTVVPIGGQGSDLVLDEPRGVLYVANFTANRVEKLSTKDNSIHGSINVGRQPGALALSPDGQFLVIAHYGPWTTASQANFLTVIRLGNNAQRVFALDSPPLGVAFGADGLALVVTAGEFLTLDPSTGGIRVLATIPEVTAHMLPQPLNTFPPKIIAASMAASGDGWHIYGLADTFRFNYEVKSRWIFAYGYTATPPMGPRVLSANHDGSYYTAGWGLFDAPGNLVAEFRNPSGVLNVGSSAIDSVAGVIYAQIQEAVSQDSSGSPDSTPAPAAPPVLRIVDADNLTLRQKLSLPENLAGRSVLNSSGTVLYALSDSGVLVLPVGRLQDTHRVSAAEEDLVFRANPCDRGPSVQQLHISDPGGGNTDFALVSSNPAITLSPSHGVTPATVSVRVDLSAFQGRTGTVVESIQLQSASAINLPDPVRVLINSRTPELRGTFVDVPGTLVDILADPVRNRFYVLRQDKNRVLVFDAETAAQVATLRTSNTPTQLAFSFDHKYLLIGHDDSQLAYVYDLDTLKATPPVIFPPGHYPRSIAASGRATLAACRVAGPDHQIDAIDLISRTAQTWPTLGTFENTIHLNTMLTASPNGSSILGVMADGNVVLYNAAADTFTLSRKDFTALQGPYAASSSNQFVVGDNLLNESLVPVMKFGNGQDVSSGFAFVGGLGLRTTATSNGPGIIEHVDLNSGDPLRSTRMVECPLTGTPDAAFTRTLAPLANGKSIVSLTTSGFTILPAQYDAAVIPPQLNSVVNAADFSSAVAPGGLIAIFGTNLAPTNMATNELPLPTALGESCLTLNGALLPMLFVSPQQINAQLPFDADGSGTLVLNTPGGISNNYGLTLSSAAPSIFRTGVAGPDTGIPTVIRLHNNQFVTPTNPIHPGDTIVIYATGMGRTSPAVTAGQAAPSNPLSQVDDQPIVTLGGVALTVGYAGLVPGEVGVYQINATVPHGLAQDIKVPLTIAQSGGTTSLNVRVVK